MLDFRKYHSKKCVRLQIVDTFINNHCRGADRNLELPYKLDLVFF